VTNGSDTLSEDGSVTVLGYAVLLGGFVELGGVVDGKFLSSTFLFDEINVLIPGTLLQI
jgi:hypothetical protein